VSDKNLVLRLISAVWSGVDGVRKILHLILLLVLFAVVFGAMQDAPLVLPERAALVVKPYGYLVEQVEGDPFDRALAELAGDGRPQTLVQDIVDALDHAKDDDRIEIVHLEMSSMLGGGLSKLQRLAAAIEDFRSSGKSVIATGDFFSQQGYYVAAHADEVYLHPEGMILLQGYGRWRSYYKDAIDLLRIDWNVFRVGTHKSFVEPYTRMDMSDEDRETTLHLVDQLWSMYESGVEAARELPPGSIENYTTNFVDILASQGGDFAMAAAENGLVDDLLRRTEIRDLLIDKVGQDAEHMDAYEAIGMYEYLAQMRVMSGSSAREKNVAVIIASGDIMFGDQSPGMVGSESTTALLRQARNDESIEAVVLRVDSPGGSAFASEIIMDEIVALQNAGKPVIASMGSVAASGGYAISARADRIFASPATITGSIGVFGMFPTYQRTLGAIGIATDGAGSTPLSGEFRPDREMSEKSKQLFQLAINDYYDDFVTLVADSRNMDIEAVDEIGQGRSWTGVDALGNGLVDELGSLDDAVAAAAELAGLTDEDYGVKLIEQELSPTEQMLLDLLGTISALGVDVKGWAGPPSLVDSIVDDIAAKAGSLAQFNDPRGIYSHCFCDLR
jgi:protease-4